MPQKNAKQEKTSLAPIIIPAIVGAISTIAAAYFSYSAGVNAIQIPLNATQTAEVRQLSAVQSTAIPAISTTPASNNQETPIEQLSAKVYVLDFDDGSSQEVKAAISNRLEIITGLESGIAYKQTYIFPDNAPVAGLYFLFSPEIDINEYQAVTFTINRKPGLQIQFILANEENNSKFIDLSSSFFGTETSIKVDGGDFYIPIKNFDNISTIKWLYFLITSANTKNSSTIEYEVSNIRFIK